MKCLAKNSVHSKSTIQKNILGRFFGSSKNRVFKIVLLVFGLLSMLGSTHALFNGTVGLDLGFNILSPVEFNAEVRAVVVQSDGKMVVGGGFTIYSGETANRIVRLNSDGSRDVSFLGAGTNNPVYVVAIQSDGKILIGGSFVRYDGTTSNRIARLNSNGTIDTGFIIGGGFNDAVYDVKVQADGKILVGGNFTTYSGASAPYFVRLNSDGTRDTSFTNFAFNGYIYTIAIQDDDKILVGGAFTLYSGATANRIIRLNSDGTRDTSFLGAGAGNGIVYAIGRQSDGKIIIGGSFTSYNGGGIARILRLNTDGTKDTSFLGAGAGGAVWSLAIQSGDKIVVGGAFTTYNGVATNRIVGLNADGTTDVNFVVGNGADGIVYALTLQSDEKIIAGGAFTQYNGQGANYFVRLNTDGTKDTNPAGYGFNSYILTLTIQSDQKILVGGGFTTYSGTIANKIVRLNSDGTRDSTFSVGDGCVGNVYVFAVQGDGKILVGGDCTSYDGVTANRIFRLNSDGTRDTSFLGAGANGTVYDIKIQSDGKILVAGNFTTYSGASSPYLVRLNSDGTKDTSFVPGTFNAYVYSVDIQSDGKIVAGGNFTTHNTITTNRLIRLTSTGARDTSFSIGAGLSAYPQKIIVQEDQKILIGGTFGTYSGATVNRIVRLNSDGTRDTSFVGGTAFNGSTRGIIIQSDGKMIVGGAYTSYNGVLRNRIVRINTDGSPDVSFSIGGGFNEQIYALAAQANGKILVGGNFTQYDGALAGYIASLYVLQPPTLLSPLSGDVDQSTSKDFLRSPSVDSGVVGYIYQVSTDSGFSTFTTSGTTTQTGISLTGFTEGMYYRRVAVYDAAGNIGGRSTTENFIVTPTDWDNSQFITGAFRASNPSDTKIIYALFGDGNGGTGRSAYTKNRDTINCSLGSMVVTGISPGTNTLPVNLSANTIYVLESGEYIVSATRTLQNCTAIIGKGDVVLKANYTTNTRLLSSDSKSNRILDNLKLDRNRGVATSTSMDVIYTLSSPNNSINAVEAYSGYSGIYVYLGSNYLSITNSKAYDNLSIGMYIRKSTYGVISSADIYNNTSYGVYFNGSDTGNLINSQIHDNSTHGVYYNLSNNGKIENSQVYNNGSYGIYFNTSHNGIIKNSQIFNSTNRGVSYIVSNSGQILDSQIYNNGDYGITIYNDSQYTTINNTQLYNNANYGIYLLNGANYTTINNAQVYNNASAGIVVESGSNYSVINNVQIYNNASYGIQYKNNSASGTITTTNVFNNTREGILIDAGSINTKYYGINKIFANDAMNLSGTLANLTPGTDNMLGRSNGVIDESPTMSRDYLTNPINNAGEYLFPRTGTMTSLRGRNTSFAATSGMQYSYGSGTLLQKEPVVYDGVALIASGVYNTSNYVGGNIAKMTGDLLGINQYNSTNSVITGIASLPISTYTVYGNIQNILGGITINTSATIQLTTGIATNIIITQLYNTGEYFATHFQKITTIDDVSPSTPLLLSPMSGEVVTGSQLMFLWTTATDTGAGMGGYLYQISTNSGFTTIFASGTTIYTGIFLTGFVDGTYYRRVAAYDAVGNIGDRSSVNNFVREGIVILPPQVGTAYISSGTTGNNGSVLYYKGSIDARASLSGEGISSCKYTTGTTRVSADIQAGYCEVQNMVFTDTITLQFRATNEGGTTTGISTTYIYDATPPNGGVFTINNNIAYTTGTDVILTTTCATDTGINSTQVAFGSTSSPTNWQSCSSNLSRTLPSGDGTKTVYMRFKDGFENISEEISDTIILDTNGPSSPILLSPTHGSSSTTGSIDLLRSGSVDAGVGLSGYIWQLSTGSNFATLMSGGSTTTTGVSLSGLAMTTYYRRVYAVDLLGNTGSRSTGRSFTIAPAITFAIESPASLDLGSLATPEETQIVEKTFTGSENYFVLSDYVGDDAGYYTTLSMTNMTNGNGALLSNQNIAIKTATNIVTIAGSSNPNVVSAITGSYRTFGNDVLTFIKRDPGPNAGMIGTYGVSPALKVTIPQLQNSGNYSGTLIYTIYPN